MKSIINHLFLLLLTCPLTAQQAVHHIEQLSTVPKIDGELSEQVWGEVAEISEFTTTLPQPGKTPQQPTIVHIGYTREGIFIAATCFSTHVRDDGSVKDESGTGDYFSVGLDTWNDNQNAFVFTLTAGGQLNEQRITSNLTEPGYNCSWHAATHLEADRWTLEMHIPFSSLRFPTKKIQEWGLQFTRFDRYSGETSTWSPQDPLVQDVVLQYGQMEGLTMAGKVRPMGYSAWGKYDRLFFRHVEMGVPGVFNHQKSQGFQPGFDVRWGFNTASVFDVSVFPEIKIINSETYYAENDPFSLHPSEPRQLFTNESGLFNKSLSQIRFPNLTDKHMAAMSKRAPSDIYLFQKIPLINTTKFTSRTRNGIGFGIINSLYSGVDFNITREGFKTRHTYRLPTVNQIAVDKTFRNNSWIQISNIHYAIADSISDNMAALAGQWRDRSNQFEVAGVMHLHTIAKGYSKASGNVSVQKVNGAWRWGVSYTSPQTPGIAFFTDSTFSEDQTNRHTIATHIGRYNYHPDNPHLLQTVILFTNKEQKEKGKEQWLLWANDITASALFRNFQRITVHLSTFQTSREEKLVFPEQVFFRKNPFLTQLTVNWLSDERKKFMFGAGGGLTQRWGVREPGYLINTLLQWVPDPQFIFRYKNQLDIYQHKLQARPYYFPENAVQIYNDWTLRQTVGCLFNPFQQLTFSLDWVFVNRFQSNSRYYIIQENSDLTPALPLNSNPYKDWLRNPVLAAAFNFSPNRQLRLQWQKTSAHIDNDFSSQYVEVQHHFNTFSVQLIWSFYK